ncbi:hypothetical protein GCM10010912_39160 [Paenibacillus albidus]|uniref:DUF4261 domain-containing protein n=1 Tax=Paenibacillus albidus TaxID=2041023 RepID=A0A917CKC2_9BACL|nr:DUF4261 domain-containing protein [Paenibacillus albidus]GGF90158.1 hypothetical protein GCM10010912_39160 [Paenibacillus albidus]
MGMFDRLRRKKQAAAEEPIRAEEQAELILGFALLESGECDFDRFIANMKKEWDIDVEDRPDQDNLMFSVDGMQVVCAYIPARIPDNEAEDCCKYNLLWPDAEQVVSRHQAQIIITVLNYDDVLDGYQLFTKTASAWLQLDNALALYMAPLVVEAGKYVETAQMLHEEGLPVSLWVFIGLYRTEQKASAYTRGLRTFGKEELEIISSGESLEDVFELMFMVTDYIVGDDVTLRHGETIGFTAEQKLPITLSQGGAVEGQTLKIGY